MVQAFAPRTTSSTEALGLEFMIDGKHCTECGHLKWWSICSNQKWYLKCLFTSKKSFEIFCDQKPVNLKELKWCLREASKRLRYRHSYTVSLLILDTRTHHFFEPTINMECPLSLKQRTLQFFNELLRR